VNFITVRCTKCPQHNQRLFDVSNNARGIIKIKCSKCGSVIPIDLENYHKEINTEPNFKGA
jgi:ribosomal protein S27E